MTDSNALLADYAQNGTESAFHELVARYIDLVYSTALRQVGGDAHLAEDVAQMVFMCLAKKAQAMPREVMLGGWLHQTTRRVAATVRRAERRRRSRENQAVQMNAVHGEGRESLEQVAHVLDDAIAQLSQEDRLPILLRFFEKRNFRSVGEELGASEDAARMRVNRALEKLGLILKRRGVAMSGATLGAALAATAVSAAPAGLAATVAGDVLSGLAAACATTLTVFKIMTFSKLQLGAMSALAIGALTTALILQSQSLSRLREQNRLLQQKVQALVPADQTAPPAVDQNELAKLRQDQSELLRLRSEVTALRKASKLAALQSAAAGDPTSSTGSITSADVMRLQTNVRAQVGTGQTLLTGGWADEPGKRVFILATPRVQGENNDQVRIQTKVVEVPESALAQVGLDSFTVEGSESSLQQIWPVERVQQLLRALEGTDGAKLVAEHSIITSDGRQAEVQTMDQQVSEGTQPLDPVINIVPVISADKSAVEITLHAGLNQLRR